MALTEETVIDQVLVDESGIIFVRSRTDVLRDGATIASTYHRASYEPGVDLSKESAKVQGIAAVAWDDDVRAAWKAKRAAAV